VGLEREMQGVKSKEKNFGGFRTFAMIAALGYLATKLETEFQVYPLIVVVLVLLFLLIAISHYFAVAKEGSFGVTSEFSALASFLVGVLVAFEQIFLALALAIVFAGMLSIRDFTQKIAKRFDQEEFTAIIKFLIIAGVVLPILPNRTIDLPLVPPEMEFFNPFSTWLMVVLVAGIRFIGFFLAKIVGSKKSIILTGAVGGLVSSTAVTSSLAEQNKDAKEGYQPFFIGIMIASAIMFVRVFVEAQIVYPDLALKLAFPLFSMSAISVLLAVLVLIRQKSADAKQHKEVPTSQPFSLSEGLKFGLFFLGVLAAAKILGSDEVFGDAGHYFIALVSGLADTDAITLSYSKLAKSGEMAFNTAVIGITIGVMTNTLVKLGIVLVFAGSELKRRTVQAVLLTLLIGGLSLLLI
jgi:uncharacterized membrane protein (DUF4010 family)